MVPNKNNIILAGEGTHNFTPFLDSNPACLPDAKYKGLAGDTKGLKAYKSADGIRWSLMEEKPVITNGDFDSQNLAFWHPVQKRYVAYHRKGRDGVRDIMTSVSSDFLNGMIRDTSIMVTLLPNTSIRMPLA